MIFQIDQQLRQAHNAEESTLALSMGRGPDSRQRPEFRDPLLASLQGVALHRVIDQELDRFYNPSSTMDVITRVFRRFRRAN